MGAGESHELPPRADTIRQRTRQSHRRQSTAGDAHRRKKKVLVSRGGGGGGGGGGGSNIGGGGGGGGVERGEDGSWKSDGRNGQTREGRGTPLWSDRRERRPEQKLLRRVGDGAVLELPSKTTMSW